MLSPEHSDMKHLISLHFPWVQVGATIVSGVSHSPFHCHLKQLDFYYLWLIPQMAIEFKINFLLLANAFENNLIEFIFNKNRITRDYN